jgi:pimeloyl-ACP methyl ester carboxylesterase
MQREQLDWGLMMNNLPVYALPGLLDDERLWQHQATALLPHHPFFTADLTEHDSIAALARAALSRAPAERFALLGLSMGGYVALEIMRQAPERVLALALLDTSARPDSEQATELRRELIELAKTDFDAVVDGITPRLLHPSHLRDETIVRLISDMAHSVGASAFVRQQKAIMNRVDSRPLLHAIECPTLVLCGREDLLTPVELHEEMASRIPNAKLVVIEQCGHMSALEQPQQVCAALQTWLSAVQV